MRATSKIKVDGKIENTGAIIQGDNSGGHCFVLRDLGSINKKLSSRLAYFGC